MLAREVTQFPNGRAMLKIDRQAPHVHASHAAIGFDVVSVVLALAQADKAFLAKHIEPKAASPIVQRSGGKDEKDTHRIGPYFKLWAIARQAAWL